MAPGWIISSIKTKSTISSLQQDNKSQFEWIYIVYTSVLLACKGDVFQKTQIKTDLKSKSKKTYAETGGNLRMDFFPNKKRRKTPSFSECHHLCGSLATGDHVHQRLEEGACVAWFLLVTWFIFDANIFGIYLSTLSIYLLISTLCITYHHYPHIAFHDRKRLGNFLPHVHMRTPKLWTFPVLRIKLPLQNDLSAQDFEVEK